MKNIKYDFFAIDITPYREALDIDEFILKLTEAKEELKSKNYYNIRIYSIFDPHTGEVEYYLGGTIDDN